MSTTLLTPTSTPAGSSGRPAWALVRRAGLLLARVIAWFAADPQRPRAVAGAVTACVGVGAVIGLGLGLAATRVVTTVLQAVIDQQSR